MVWAKGNSFSSESLEKFWLSVLKMQKMTTNDCGIVNYMIWGSYRKYTAVCIASQTLFNHMFTHIPLSPIYQTGPWPY